MAKLDGKKVAIITTHGFEESELKDPKQAIEESGAKTAVITPDGNEVRGWSSGEWSSSIAADMAISQANAADFDALLIPGGTYNCDKLRKDGASVKFVREFFKAGKPVAAICHGPQMLIEADVLQGRRVTSYDSIKTDLKNAGADWVDEEVVVDQGLVTSRNPGDLPAFIAKTIEEIGEGKHEGQHA